MEEDNKNTSGHGEGGYVPEEVANHFNWGAFFLSWIWGIGNHSFKKTMIIIGFVAFCIGYVMFASAARVTVGWGFGLFYHIVLLSLGVWFGIKGNTWAWQNKEWESIEKFHKVQRTWAIVSLILLGIPYLIWILIFAVSLILSAFYLSNPPEIQNQERPAVSKVIDIKKPSFNRVKLPPQTYEEWQKKYDPNYVPENKLKLPSPKPRAKKVPQTYEEWLKKNPENK